MFTTEENAELTVEQVLGELKEIFNNCWFELKASHVERELWWFINGAGKPRQGQGCRTLSEAMAQVRKWKESR